MFVVSDELAREIGSICFNGLIKDSELPGCGPIKDLVENGELADNLRSMFNLSGLDREKIQYKLMKELYVYLDRYKSSSLTIAGS